jgi:sugar lactone lactonase YvrE
MGRELKAFGPPGRFYEVPHWRDGRWFVSDMRDGTVFSYGADGTAKVEVKLDGGGRPGGISWTPQGDLLVVSMDAKTLFRRKAGEATAKPFVEMAEIAGDTVGFLNDMVVDPAGHIYIGFDADHLKYHDARGLLVCVSPEGQARVVADELAMPNGMVVSKDGKTLIVAETMRPQFLAFDIAADGALSNRRVWSELAPRVEGKAIAFDGCDIDAEGCIWVADVWAGCLRMAPGGKVVDAIPMPQGLHSFACGLGGPDGRTLMICTGDSDFADRASRKSSFLYTAQVDVPGQGA